MSRHPEVKWAQRSDKVFLTVELPDAKEPNVKIEPEGKFTFSATVGKENLPYELNLELSNKIDVEESKVSIGLRHVFCVLKKSEKEWWVRLLKGGGKTPGYIKVDWDKWVDEDEEDEKAPLDNFDLGGMGGMSDLSNLDMGAGMDSDDDEDIEEEQKDADEKKA